MTCSRSIEIYFLQHSHSCPTSVENRRSLGTRNRRYVVKQHLVDDPPSPKEPSPSPPVYKVRWNRWHCSLGRRGEPARCITRTEECVCKGNFRSYRGCVQSAALFQTTFLNPSSGELPSRVMAIRGDSLRCRQKKRHRSLSRSSVIAAASRRRKILLASLLVKVILATCVSPINQAQVIKIINQAGLFIDCAARPSNGSSSRRERISRLIIYACVQRNANIVAFACEMTVTAILLREGSDHEYSLRAFRETAPLYSRKLHAGLLYASSTGDVLIGERWNFFFFP